MIRAVAFDVMDTVLRDPYREALEAATGVAVEDFFAARDPHLHPAFERGELDEAAYWAMHADAGIVVDTAAFHRVRRRATTWLPGMAELLDDLAGRVRRVTASNYPIWFDDLVAEHLTGRFEDAVASCHLGVRKPEASFYRRMLHTIGLRADEVLFVDDRPGNVAGAQQVGLTSHRFVDAASLRRWLVDQGVDVPGP